MAANAANTIRPAGWSGELQQLQDETMRLLHTIRGDNDSRRQEQQPQQQPSRHGQRNSGKLGGKGGEATAAAEGSGVRRSVGGNTTSRRRRRRRRPSRDSPGGSQGHDSANGPRRFSYTLDTSGWPRGNETGSSDLQASDMGMGKTTVEVLDRGEETPRTPPLADRPAGDILASQATPKVPQATALAAAGEYEGRFRSLSFKDEEGRVRDGFDTFVPAKSGGLREGLQKLRAERDRLAGIEEEQRKICREENQLEFVRFARRKWLASDLAAESVQRVFRGHIGRRRAALNAEVRRLTGEARMEWVEASALTVRDHNRGEAWYFNPLTGKSQWDRPDSLLGTITPSDKVRTLPALGPPSPSKKRPLPKGFDSTTEGGKIGGAQSYAGVGGKGHISSPQETGGTSPTKVSAVPSRSGPGGTGNGKANPATLPPLMKGSRLSVLDAAAVATPGKGGGLAPSCGPGGSTPATPGGRWRDKQQAWVEREQQGGGGEGREGGEEAFPFLAEDEMMEMLPDDRFEETGLGLARRAEDEEESDQSEDSGDGANGTARGFFLADGTPNIRLRRTIAKALRVTKFDSVSTLLADYTGRKIAAASTGNGEAATAAVSSPSKARRRAATAAPASGSTSFRTSSKRRRNNNNNNNNTPGEMAENPEEVGNGGPDATAKGFQLDRNAPYPSGKLEEDRNPPLFSADGGGGRKMVSLMTAALGRRKGGSGGRRRAKTAGVAAAARAKQEGTRGSALGGLAIRDLTPPGFLPSTEAAGDGAARPATSGGDATASASTNQNAETSGNTATGSETKPQAAGEGKAAGPGAATSEDQEGKTEDAQKVKEICFNCWSKGSGKTCTLHSGGAAGGKGGTDAGGGAGKAAGEARVAESVLMCKNWDVGVMRRRYRAEEIQEVFAKEASSLRYDKERKKFIATVEQRHPIYRLLAKIIAGYNFTVRRKLHQKNWLRGFVEQLRVGKVVGISSDEARQTSKLLRLRNTLQNAAQVMSYTSNVNVKAVQPQPPITGTTLAEKRGLVKVLVDRPSKVMGRVTRVVLDGPTPVPQVLYEARRYPLPAAKTMPMPEPKYLDDEAADDATVLGEKGRGGGGAGSAATNVRAAWMVLLCEATVEGVIRSAITNVEVMSPVPGSDEVARTKYPPALTIKFATFSRKPTPAMMAVGGLPAEMVVHMLVSTRMAPQYGNFTVMQKSSVAPTVSEERTAEYESLELLVENQAYLPRALQHPLNSRRAPTASA
ncbi:unnamed protein product [Ectocarpus fasciculatus]